MKLSARVPDPAVAGSLREALARSNYTEGGMRVALGGTSESSPGDAPVHARMLGENDQAILVRLFLLGLEVEAGRAARALAPASVGELERAGMLERSGARGVRCPIRISPFEGLLLAHDAPVLEDPAPDIVTGLNSAARTLAALTPRRAAGRALDVGTGCGVQALLAARHADAVVATDVNPRALDFTRLGAALNGFEHVECRAGSFFDPVVGERFDLIASNPPYVISPDDELVYRDGGLERDEVSRIALTGAAEHLSDGGHAMLLCNWIREPWEPWVDPLKRWLERSGCDALFLHHLSEEPLEYAAKWNARFRSDPQVLDAVLERWMAWYAEQGIGSLCTGAVALRKRAEGEPVHATAEMAGAPAGRAGEHVLRLLAAARLLSERDAEGLLSLRLTVVPGHRLLRERRHADGGYGAETVRVLLDDNAGLSAELGPVVAALLVGLDGSRSPSDLMPLLARSLPGEPGEVRTAVAAVVRELLEQGLLEGP